jgi:peptide/nickel transport system ATP-binding protein
MIFQEPMTALNPLMRIGDQVAETVKLHSGVGRRGREHGAQALDASDCSARRERSTAIPMNCPAGGGSGWLFAMAVVLSPPLLIADEPTTALDAGAQAQVLAVLLELARRRAWGLILVSHDWR